MLNGCSGDASRADVLLLFHFAVDGLVGEKPVLPKDASKSNWGTGSFA
jgi:hypothetical protein